jgi:hypothetical protein
MFAASAHRLVSVPGLVLLVLALLGLAPAVAAQATPTAEVMVTPLAAAVADAFPADADVIMMRRVTYGPGDRSGAGTFVGPNLEYVESGVLIYEADVPLTVAVAAGTGTPVSRETAPTGQAVAVGPGEAVLVPLGATANKHNDGTEPAVVVGAFLGSGGGTLLLGGDLVVFHLTDPHILPPAPALVTLSRVTLPPGARWSPPAAPWRMLAVAEEAYPNVEQAADGVTTNGGTGPLDLYLTTVEPIGAPATPAS